MIGRAAILLIIFIIATAVSLRQVNAPTPAASAAAATTTTVAGATTTSTSHPGATTTTTTPPSRVPVVVANGSNVSGAAGSISTQLQSAGWQVLPAENATSNVTASVVYYVAGFQPSAAAIARLLGVPTSGIQPLTSAAPVGAVGSADVVVVVGPDVASKIGTSTTTTHPATTTTHPSTSTTHPATTTTKAKS
ncbi:MAG TPA: LytR C-terminal domain-containing protein [Acidimicrobiales bacterium]|jgi:hypothetical protein|nr:LytR C-terminal domain-containing protein [Acidimicrobiales bacterium]